MLSRRDFVAASAALLPAAPFVHARRADFDLVIRGGSVHDGLGSAARAVDVGVRSGRIAALAPSLGRGTREVEARGLVVAPGFVDIHSHGDGSLESDPRAESVIRQGITTIVAGQDGGSRLEVGDYFTRLETIRPAVNVATMVGLGTVRGGVVGVDDRPATADELARMVQLVERALAEGACGASSGLEYTPGAFARADELVALARPLATRGLVYASHMRNEDDRLLDAIRETIAVGERAGCGVQISHLKTQGPRNWGVLDEVFATVEAAERRGVHIAFDRYPYLAYQTGLTNLFPVWSRDGGTDAFLARLEDSTTAARIREATLAKVELIGGWDNVQVTSVREAQDSDVEGKRLGTWAAARNEDPYEAAVGLITRNRGSVGMVGFAMSETNLERILAHRLGMVCSDGGAFAIDGPTRRGAPHPRGIGSFPRVLGRYVRERGTLSLASAIHKMSGLPASRLRLDRGRIAVGAPADLVVFDDATVNDRATYDDPFQYPVGMMAVAVNGVLALAEGERTADRAGVPVGPVSKGG